MALAAGSELRTAAAGRAVVTQGGDVVEASPNSAATFPRRESSSTPSVLQNAGTLVYKIVTRPADRFNVRTPYLTAVIKGTVFSVTVDSDGGALHVTRGAVEVTSQLTGEVAMVNPGQTAAVSSRPGMRMQMLGAPADKKDTKADTKADSSVPADNSMASASEKGAALRSSVSAISGEGNAAGRGKGLATSINAGRVDVFAASKGLINGAAQGNGQGPDRADRATASSRAGGNPWAGTSPAAAARDAVSIASNGNGGGNGNVGGN
ncbi:MAG: FecR domain-containing protein, partial [Rhodospirillaceae bacterium]